MEFAAHKRDVLALQEATKSVGQPVTYIADGVSRELRGRVRYMSATELANSIEQYAIAVSFDARDFPTAPPMKGDSIIVDGARRGVMQVTQQRASGHLIGYRCGVQG
jgi:hypothetical protein